MLSSSLSAAFLAKNVSSDQRQSMSSKSLKTLFRLCMPDDDSIKSREMHISWRDSVSFVGSMGCCLVLLCRCCFLCLFGLDDCCGCCPPVFVLTLLVLRERTVPLETAVWFLRFLLRLWTSWLSIVSMYGALLS